LILHCNGNGCSAEIHQGGESPFVYVVAQFRIVHKGKQLSPELVGYRCPVNNSYCATLEENLGLLPG
ncbi:MAG: hypothetical protein WBM00_03135, partial [Solirubrobacterales bacterium]